jgi:hypothetical protein
MSCVEIQTIFGCFTVAFLFVAPSDLQVMNLVDLTAQREGEREVAKRD